LVEDWGLMVLSAQQGYIVPLKYSLVKSLISVR